MTTTKPTAKTFREPLIRSLGTAANLTAEAPVRMNDVLPLVYTDSGIAEDAYGKDKNGWFHTRLWVQQCYKMLRKQGIAIKAGRGKWGLSAEGVKVAATLLGQTPPAPTDAADEDIDLDAILDSVAAPDPGSNAPAPVATTDDTDADTTTPAAPAAPVHDGGEGVAFALGPQVNSYNEDPYIRGLAIESTKCFGKYSARSTVCQSCALSGACKATVLSDLSSIGASLRKRDADAVLRAALPPKPAKSVSDDDDIDDIIAAIEEEVDGPKAQADGDVRLIDVPADGKCRHCKKKVERGSKAKYRQNAGLYHIKCHDEAFGKWGRYVNRQNARQHPDTDPRDGRLTR